MNSGDVEDKLNDYTKFYIGTQTNSNSKADRDPYLYGTLYVRTVHDRD